MNTKQSYLNSANKSSNVYYVYVHKKATDNSIFYVGKGKGRRAYTKSGRSQYWQNIVNKHGFTVEIVQNYLPEWLALELEVYLISYYKYSGVTLCNLTVGGETGSMLGGKHKESTKLKMSVSAQGVNNHNAKLANVFCYTTGKLLAKSVVISEWCRLNGYNASHLCATTKANREFTHHWKVNPHHHKMIYAEYVT